MLWGRSSKLSYMTLGVPLKSVGAWNVYFHQIGIRIVKKCINRLGGMDAMVSNLLIAGLVPKVVSPGTRSAQSVL